MRTITGLAALAALSAIATPAAAANPKAPKADNRPPFSAQDLVTLPRLGAAAVSADGALAVYPLTETEPGIWTCPVTNTRYRQVGADRLEEE